MTKNRIVKISSHEIDSIINKDKKNNCYSVILDGRQVQFKEEFFQIMGLKYNLPDISGWDSFTDWMTDLSWIDNKCFSFLGRKSSDNNGGRRKS
ncbi:hypothetical protein [Oceanobacillus sp. J11TS1]|uniref:barstar family protein n=1 Tax=Oceanobacillus sp. J11TS1 TaxID=2807191 RepID=UPI001B17F7F0|nr:hypothetical protein [Oceanobacillus sp. J11TS1]GIO22186.1 hypothetical protein J11TS1_07670 [Oceanobacillus sp. J11TS1]